MKNRIISFKLEPVKPRNRVAEDMFDRSGPYKSKRERSEAQYRRREKHRGRQFEY